MAIFAEKNLFLRSLRVRPEKQLIWQKNLSKANQNKFDFQLQTRLQSYRKSFHVPKLNQIHLQSYGTSPENNFLALPRSRQHKCQHPSEELLHQVFMALLWSVSLANLQFHTNKTFLPTKYVGFEWWYILFVCGFLILLDLFYGELFNNL